MNCPTFTPARATTRLCQPLLALAAFWAVLSAVAGAMAATTAELKNLSIQGGLEDGKARLILEAALSGFSSGDRDEGVHATRLHHGVRVERDQVLHSVEATFETVSGKLRELTLGIEGEGVIRQVTGGSLQDWSIRHATNGARSLVLRPREAQTAGSRFSVTIEAEQRLAPVPSSQVLLSLAPARAALSHGYLRITWAHELDVKAEGAAGLIPIEPDFLPEEFSRNARRAEAEGESLAYRFHGTNYRLALKAAFADPEAGRVVLRDFQLTGQLEDTRAAFTLAVTAIVKNPKGGTLRLLSGGVALTGSSGGSQPAAPSWRIDFREGEFFVVFDRAGEFPLRIDFNAAVREQDGWNEVEFRVAPAALQPIVIRGRSAETQFRFAGAARLERRGDLFAGYLPASGVVKLAWKETAPQTAGKLFYSAEILEQISISPGLMRQTAIVDFKVMQGELHRVTLLLRGEGEVTRVLGNEVLAWQIEPGRNASERQLVVRLNQSQKDRFTLHVQTQMPLGAFPQTIVPVRVAAEDPTRFAGYVRVVNDGAVRLEVVRSDGLSQISPEQFPHSEASKAVFRESGHQRFAYRFSSAQHSLEIHADHIVPEISVSQVAAYHVGENERSIQADLEMDIREAPVRELLLRVPRGYAVARLNAAGLSDYFVRDTSETGSEVRLVYAAPTAGRQLIQLRLERSQALGEATWSLPRIEVERAKSVRGFVGISADAGLRLVPELTQSLTEMATAFFPAKIAGLQNAFRLQEPAWQARVRIERIPQSVLADAFHLFSIGEGITYGSSVIQYAVSGAPIAAFRVELASDYFNVEFTGKDVRGWQKTENGYLVQLHAPVAGAYTLLATYERPFKTQGESLAFTGARALDAPVEKGHTVVISAYQFQVEPVEVSPNLLRLEPGEVPAEYRLFFDAPVLAAYRYNARPFNLRLTLSPLAQGESVSQIVDRASLTSRISSEGQVLTDARYFVKNRGHTHLRLTLPTGVELWSATVNGVSVVPVKDSQANLIPLPQRHDPNALLDVHLKLASRSREARRVRVAAPVLAAPVMLAEWKLEPDAGQRLIYRRGSLTPMSGVADVSGFAGLTRTFAEANGRWAIVQLLAALALAALGALVWRWTRSEGVYRFSARHVAGTFVGLAAVTLSFAALLNLAELASQQSRPVPRDVALLAPVQQTGSVLSVEVANVSERWTALRVVELTWPIALALVVWVYGITFATAKTRRVATLLGWLILAWAALRWPNGAVGFLTVIAAFLLLHVVIPAARWLAETPRHPKPEPSSPLAGGAGPAVATLVAGLILLALLSSRPAFAANNENGASALSPATKAASIKTMNPPVKDRPVRAETIDHEIRVEGDFVVARAIFRWRGLQGQVLPLMGAPAVLTHVDYPTNALKLVESIEGSRSRHELLALGSGVFEIAVEYQLQISRRDKEHGFQLPTQQGLINRVALSLSNLDVDVLSPQAVSIQRTAAGAGTKAQLVFPPVDSIWIGWRPRERDVKREAPIFFAEVSQVYVPGAGAIEGVHQIVLRPAQGEVSELTFSIPRGFTVTDVTDAAAGAVVAQTNGVPRLDQSLVALWRFDPDAQKLRVTLRTAQSRPFALIVHSQLSTGPSPIEVTIGVIAVERAAGAVGLVGVATGLELQLDEVNASGASPINLEDFPQAALKRVQGQAPGLALRRAYRYSGAETSISLKASAVEPDIRVETQETLSLSEDRITLASQAQVDITRAGIFRLSFLLPAEMDVDSISGAALSHWTELSSPAGRVVTLHLRNKAEGRQPFSISLSGPGVKSARGWAVPRLVFREASKHTGTLLIAPGQGLRLQVIERTGLAQLDPQKAGVRQKGVLAFRVAQLGWNLVLDVEQIDAWVQVSSLQHVTVSEAQVQVLANLQYQIENTGLKTFRVLLSTNAESVSFQGEQIADFLPSSATNGWQAWEIKLHRRVIGPYLLQARYQSRVPEGATGVEVRGVRASDVNLQRGFVAVESTGRLLVRPIEPTPSSLQPAEWQSIPRVLQKDVEAASANFAFRLTDPAFALRLQLERHDAAKLLPARVYQVALTSVISDQGVMLTQVRLDVAPGDKRLLHLTLPPEGKFWFAFVKQAGVWPWRDRDRILIPLEPQTRSSETISLEIFYSSQIGGGSARALDLRLLAPKFDLPLENITWRVYLNEKWRLADWAGSLQLQEAPAAAAVAVDLQTYLQNEGTTQRQMIREAEQWLATGNSLLEGGDAQRARRAFQSAFGLSQHDSAFNEDARVQLNNLKLQQALVGLNVRQASIAGDLPALAPKLRELQQQRELVYTPQDAKRIIDSRSAEENAALMRVAERLIQQQDAAVASPALIRASIPEQGRLYTFRRAVAVDPWAELKIEIEATVVRAASWQMRALILALTAILLYGLGNLFTGAAHATKRS